jgi:hypothetical protein
MARVMEATRQVFWILATAACYYLATRTAWVLTFPDSKVSLFFPPHAVLVAILLLYGAFVAGHRGITGTELNHRSPSCTKGASCDIQQSSLPQ